MSKRHGTSKYRNGLYMAAISGAMFLNLSQAQAAAPLVTGSDATITDNSVSSIEAYDAAIILVTDGATVLGNVELDMQSSLIIESGSLGSPNTQFDMLENSTASLSGGVVHGDVMVADSAILTVSSTQLNSFVQVINDGQAIINGGTFHGQVAAQENGVIQLELSESSTLDIGILSSTNHGSIAATQPATLAGAFTLNLDGNYNPAPGETIELLTYPSVTGVFDSMDASNHDLPGNMMLVPTYDHNSFGMVANMPGDFDMNGITNIADLIIWAQNFGSGTLFQQGDSDLDGRIRIGDLIRWAQNFGGTPTQGLPSPITAISAISAATAIPEPGTLSLLGIAFAAMSRRPRRKG